MAYKVHAWKDYWDLYSDLINLLLHNEKDAVAQELEEARKYVNGLTDGWYDFKREFENVVLMYKKELTTQELGLAEYLLITIRQSLVNR